MKDLVSFQSHTMDHQNLTKLDIDKVTYQCAESQKELQRNHRTAGQCSVLPERRLYHPDIRHRRQILQLRGHDDRRQQHVNNRQLYDQAVYGVSQHDGLRRAGGAEQIRNAHRTAMAIRCA